MGVRSALAGLLFGLDCPACGQRFAERIAAFGFYRCHACGHQWDQIYR